MIEPARRGVVKRRSRLRLVVAAGLVAAADIGLSAAVWHYSDTGLPSWSRDCAEHSAVVVFFGGENTHTTSRLETARTALQECPDMPAFLVGGARPSRDFWGSEWMKSWLAETGIAEARLRTERQSRDSRGNLDAMFAIAREEGTRRLVLVSDPLHLQRLLFEAGRTPTHETYAFETLAAYPAADRLDFLWRPHYEALAWLEQLLPEGVHRRVVDMLRP